MTDRPDPDLSHSFGRLRVADAPDVWSRVVAEVTSDASSADEMVHTFPETNGDVESETTSSAGLQDRRWLGAAAAAVLVVGGVAGLLWASGGDQAEPNSADAPLTEPSSASDLSTTTPTPVSTPYAFGDASISPAVTPAGFLITLEPTDAVELICGEPGSVHSAADEPELLGLVSVGDASIWTPNSPDGIRVLACAPEPSSAPASYRVPDELPPGDYILCRGFELDEAGCATFKVVPRSDSADPTAVPLTTLPLDTPDETDPPEL